MKWKALIQIASLKQWEISLVNKKLKADIHRSEVIDALIGKNVKIIDFNNEVHFGKLTGYEYGRYILNETDCDFAFRKSHINKIEIIK